MDLQTQCGINPFDILELVAAGASLVIVLISIGRVVDEESTSGQRALGTLGIIYGMFELLESIYLYFHYL